MAVFFGRPVCKKEFEKLHTKKQAITAEQVLLIKDLGSLYNTKPAMYVYARKQKK
jgi:hypothetical protein